MRWLEGWFGTFSGVTGAVIVLIISIFVPASSTAEQCTYGDGVSTCSSVYGPGVPPPSPGPSPLIIPLALAFLCFIGVVVGTWLDLRSSRRVGRLILLISVSLLVAVGLPFVLSAGGWAGGAVPLTIPFMLLAFVTGILACVRRDEPAPVSPAA